MPFAYSSIGQPFYRPSSLVFSIDQDRKIMPDGAWVQSRGLNNWERVCSSDGAGPRVGPDIMSTWAVVHLDIDIRAYNQYANHPHKSWEDFSKWQGIQNLEAKRWPCDIGTWGSSGIWRSGRPFRWLCRDCHLVPCLISASSAFLRQKNHPVLSPRSWQSRTSINGLMKWRKS